LKVKKQAFYYFLGLINFILIRKSATTNTIFIGDIKAKHA